MSDYKDDTWIYDANILVINTVPVRIKTNDKHFAQAWLHKQLQVLQHLQQPGTKIQVEALRNATERDYIVEVYGEITKDGSVKVFELVKNELFEKEPDEVSTDS
jgi:hypothetical protein